MEQQTLMTIDDVVAVMEEFGVTEVRGTIQFPPRLGSLKWPENAKSFGLELFAREPKKKRESPYVFVYGVIGDEMYRMCGLYFPTLTSFKESVQKFRSARQTLPHGIRGYYPGGTHPSISYLRMPLQFGWRGKDSTGELLYGSDSNLSAIRDNGYRHPFPTIPDNQH